MREPASGEPGTGVLGLLPVPASDPDGSSALSGTAVVADHLPSLVVEFSAMRSAADVLVGPPPATLIAEQASEWIDERGLKLLDRWSHLTGDAAHAGLMVLVGCQIWRWAVDTTLRRTGPGPFCVTVD